MSDPSVPSSKARSVGGPRIILRRKGRVCGVRIYRVLTVVHCKSHMLFCFRAVLLCEDGGERENSGLVNLSSLLTLKLVTS